MFWWAAGRWRVGPGELDMDMVLNALPVEVTSIVRHRLRRPLPYPAATSLLPSGAVSPPWNNRLKRYGSTAPPPRRDPHA